MKLNQSLLYTKHFILVFHSILQWHMKDSMNSKYLVRLLCLKNLKEVTLRQCVQIGLEWGEI